MPRSLFSEAGAQFLTIGSVYNHGLDQQSGNARRSRWIAASVFSAPLTRTCSKRSSLVVTPLFWSGFGRANSVSRSDAEEIMSVISDEFTKNLDDDWEPTDYGQAVSALLAQFNAACINEWP
jgi:hypothetical protein